MREIENIIYNDLKNFFGDGVKYELIKADNREELKKKIGSKFNFPKLFNGCFIGNKIFILSEKWFSNPDLNIHKENYQMVFVHELIHIFLEKKFKYNFPWWLREALVECISHKNLKNYWIIPEGASLIDISSEKDIDRINKNTFQYQYAPRFLHYCLKKYGKEKFFNFLKYFEKKDVLEGNISGYFQNSFSKSLKELSLEWVSAIKKEHMN